MTQHRAARTAFAAVVLTSLVLLFSPASDVPGGFALSDKLVHFLLFAALGATGRLAGLRVLPLALGLAAYAGVSEVLQGILPIDRHGDARDALADVLGALSGLAGVALARRNRRVGA